MFSLDNRLLRLGLSLALAVSALTAAGGCAPPAGALCDRICDCEGCSENERADCIDDFDDMAKAASDAICSDPYDALVSCYDAELQCRGDDIDADGCETEERTLGECLGEPASSGAGGGGPVAGGGSETSGDTGGGVGGSGGGAVCATCAGAMDGDTNPLCPGSDAIYGELAQCVCGGACAWDCADLCDNGWASYDCQTCLVDIEYGCGIELYACNGDY